MLLFHSYPGEVIKGWDLGVATMKKGEIARLTCKSDYAYGECGHPPKIPSDATLIFEASFSSGCLSGNHCCMSCKNHVEALKFIIIILFVEWVW